MLSLVLLPTIWITLTLSHTHKGKIHECASHKQNIIKGVNLHEMNVPYYNHPYANPTTSNSRQQHSRRRSLLTESETAPIRIVAYYDPSTVNTNVLTTDEISNLKATIGAIVNYYQQMIRVIPINGTFFWQRSCTNAVSSPYGLDCTQYYSGPYYCQNVQVPDDHFGIDYKFNYPVDEGVTRLGPGKGISNADLVLYVGADDTTQACVGSTLAHAGPCLTDQYGRPIAGNINICQSFFSAHEWKKDTETVLHELTHITVMLTSLWSGFRDENGVQRALIDVFDETNNELKTPLLLQTVRDHFNCESVTGLPVQNGSFSHWSERHVFSETMNPTIYTQQMFYSKFTLALMQDSGWYIPNFEYAEPFYFGENTGCRWFTDDCINKTTHISNFPQWYCENSYDDGCNQDNSAPGNCFYYNLYPPTQYQYFSDASKGGSVQSEYCPWIDPSVVTSPDYESVCWDIRGNSNSFDTAYEGEIWNSKSRCTKIIATNGQSDKGYCFEHECLNWDGNQYNSVNIIFNNQETITCTRNEQLTSKILESVSSRELICPDIDIVCGINTNYDSCYWGHYSDIEGKCICNVGYTGTDCNIFDTSFNADAISGPVYIPQTWHNSVCIGGFTKYPNFNDIWTFEQEYEYLPAYYLSTQLVYLWWHFLDHRWYISSAIGSGGNSCRCQVSYFTPDLTLCNGNWMCGSNQQSQSSSSYGICPYQPTFSPTPSPTNNPTPSPTSNPTKGPSNYPTPSPTINPTNNPTPSPTLNPTQNPTNNPTTVNPTNKPTTIQPSISPIQLFRKDIIIGLQYEIEEDEDCGNTTYLELIPIIETFSNESINDIIVTNDEINERISIKYTISAISEELMDEFKQKLINYLRNDNQDCFHFLDIFMTTNAGDISDIRYTNDGINIFDFENYGTTQILILILGGLIIFAFFWLCIWLIIKCKQCNGEKKKIDTIDTTLTVEFGGGRVSRRISGNDATDQLFDEALTIAHQRKYSNKSGGGQSQHIVHATPSDIQLPYNTQNQNDYLASGDEGFDL